MRTEGQSITQAVARFGVTRPTFYKAQADFDRDGLVGLLPAKRGPHGPHKITDEVRAFIEQQRLADPTLDGPALAQLIEQHFGLAVHRRTVERSLVRTKKQTSLNPRTNVPDGHALSHRYETLRNGVMQPDAPRQDLRGVALLMRQGLAAWIRSVSEPRASASCVRTRRSACGRVAVFIHHRADAGEHRGRHGLVQRC